MKNNSKLVKSADENDNWQNSEQDNPKKLTKNQKILKLRKTSQSNLQKIAKITEITQNKANIENTKALEKEIKTTENSIENLDEINQTEKNLPKNTDEKIAIKSYSSLNKEISQNLSQNQTEQNCHIPVLITKVADFLLPKSPNLEQIAKKIQPQNPSQNQIFNLQKTKLKIMDGTLGGLGYIDFLNNLVNKNAEFGHLELAFWGSDLDNLVVQKAKRIANLQAKHSNFADFVEEFENEFFDGIILDLGFSSNQLESGGRGFSHQKLDEILDLRYDIESLESASEKLLKIKDWKYLSHILYSFSGEEFSSRIAANICNLVQILNTKKTKKEKIELKVEQIVNCVCDAIPVQFLTKRNQILSRVWQALRIWTNGEFESLVRFLKVATTKLKIGGKLIIISFHSLEDKMVANFMRKIERPIVDAFGKKTQNWKLLTKKSVKPESAEILQNPRSRSAILRVLERLN